MMSIIKRIKRFGNTLSLRFRQPMRVEFNLSDACNLNCMGCSHYSPLAPKEFEGLPRLAESMSAIASIEGARKISDIYLIGGETLLYPELTKAMELARKYFPWAKISIFTNGLLLPKMSDDFWEKCRVHDMVITITRYPVNFDYDALGPLCESKRVKYEIFDDRSLEHSFFKFRLDPQKRQNKWVRHFKCYSFGCLTVIDDKIFPCAQSACVTNFNKAFGTDYKWEKGDYIPVQSLKNVKQLFRLRNLPVPFCGYCKPIITTPYALSKRVKEEWLD